MASVNRVILIGNLGRDPESRFLPDGSAVANFSIATSETWKDKTSGEKKEATEWHRLSAFGRLAEIVGEYLNKRSQVYIECKLKTRKWQDKEGQERYTTEIIVDQMKMLGSKNDEPPRDGIVPKASTRTPTPESKKPGGKFDDLDDDIPF